LVREASDDRVRNIIAQTSVPQTGIHQISIHQSSQDHLSLINRRQSSIEVIPPGYPLY
jgi:hypothetical protein